MIRAGEKESVVSVTSQYVDIQSSHGVRIPLNAIINIELKDEIPKIGRKVRGYNSFSCVRKGEFKVEGMGVGRIYIFSKKGSYLYIFAVDQFVIIAFENPDKTRQLYEKIASQRELER